MSGLRSHNGRMPDFRIVILGGYGQFGARIVAALAQVAGLHLIVAGRRLAAAQALCDECACTAQASLQAAMLDTDSADFATHLTAQRPQLVVHSAGPFQGRDYRVAQTALRAGAHYVDLADARAFVAGFSTLDNCARAANRWAISGASSVPGLSGAVVVALRTRFATLESVETAISPGNRTDRGLATTRAILSYVGRAFPLLRDDRCGRAHGWQSLRRLRVAGIGSRWVARCEVPDLSVLPMRHPDLRRCDFRAGLELRRMHFGLWLASWAVRMRIVRNLARYAEPLLALSRRWQALGSNVGVMRIDLRGRDHGGAPLHWRWQLIAANGDGPQVPATAAVVLARKLANGELPGSGARACLDFFTLDEFIAALAGYAIETTTERI